MKLTNIHIALLACLFFLIQFFGGCISHPAVPDDVLKDQNGPFTLSTSVTPDGGGTISSVQGEYDYGTEINITANPAPGYVFRNWSGDAAGNATVLTMFMTRDKMVIANFARLSTLQTYADPPESGHVVPAQGTYPDGSEVTVTAVPSEGYALEHWSGSATGYSNSATVSISGDSKVTAHFSKTSASLDKVISVVLSEVNLTTVLPDYIPSGFKPEEQLPVGQMYAVVRLRIVTVNDKFVSVKHGGELYNIDNQKYFVKSYYWDNTKQRKIDNGMSTVELFEDSTGVMIFTVPRGMPIQKLIIPFYTVDNWSESGDMIHPVETTVTIDLLNNSSVIKNDIEVEPAGATSYWIGGTGLTSDASHYSATSGGVPIYVTPNQTSPVVFDTNSGFIKTGMSVTFDTEFDCESFTVSGVSNNPSFQGSATVSIYGSFSNDSAITWDKTGVTAFKANSGIKKITTDGMLFGTGSGVFQINGSGGTFRLADDISFGGTMVLSLIAGQFDPDGNTVTCLGNGNSLTTDWNFYNLTVSSTAARTDSFTISSGKTITVTNRCSLSGDSSANRLLVQSSIPGQPANIDANILTGVNLDMMDVTSKNAVDLSSVTGFSGDCGGNSNITFTSPSTQTWAGGSGYWSDPGKWTSRIPLPQDNVMVSGSGTITGDMPRIGKNVSFSGEVTFTPGYSWSVYGSLSFDDTTTYEHNRKSISLNGRGNYTLDTPDEYMRTVVINNVGGIYTLSDNWHSGVLYGRYGELDTGLYDIDSLSSFWIQKGYDFTLTLNDSDVYVTSPYAGTKWNIQGTLHLDSGTSHIHFTSSGTDTMIYDLNGLTYYDVSIEGTGDYVSIIQGSNWFNTFSIDASEAAKTVKFTDGTTQSVAEFLRDSSENIIILTGTGTEGWMLNSTTGSPVSLDYVDVSYLKVFNADTWFMGIHSIDSGFNNTNVIFDSY